MGRWLALKERLPDLIVIARLVRLLTGDDHDLLILGETSGLVEDSALVVELLVGLSGSAPGTQSRTRARASRIG